jgi:hypothetical protein
VRSGGEPDPAGDRRDGQGADHGSIGTPSNDGNPGATSDACWTPQEPRVMGISSGFAPRLSVAPGAFVGAFRRFCAARAVWRRAASGRPELAGLHPAARSQPHRASRIAGHHVLDVRGGLGVACEDEHAKRLAGRHLPIVVTPRS